MIQGLCFHARAWKCELVILPFSSARFDLSTKFSHNLCFLVQTKSADLWAHLLPPEYASMHSDAFALPCDVVEIEFVTPNISSFTLVGDFYLHVAATYVHQVSPTCHQWSLTCTGLIEIEPAILLAIAKSAGWKTLPFCFVYIQ